MEEEWESNIGKINSWLANSLDPTVGFQLVKFAHPKDAWEYLGWLDVQTSSVKQYKLDQDIRNAHKGDDSIFAFYVKMTKLCNYLSFMDS